MCDKLKMKLGSYTRRNHLNLELFRAHLKTAQEWNGTWHLLSTQIHAPINLEGSHKYKTIHEKLDKLIRQQIKSPESNTEFYPRVVNDTDISFTTDELSVLNQGLKYNLHYKNDNWLHTLALDADAAATHLPSHEQDGTRHLMAQHIQQLHRQQKQGRIHNTIHAKKEEHTLHSIKEKLTKNNAVITKAEKGSSIVITYAHDYHKKIVQFISSNNFDTVPHDPTNRFQKSLRFNINCPILIPQDQKWRYVNFNPTPPTIRGLIKLHNRDTPSDLP
jgi:hypothetical protein